MRVFLREKLLLLSEVQLAKKRIEAPAEKTAGHTEIDNFTIIMADGIYAVHNELFHGSISLIVLVMRCYSFVKH